MNKRNMQKIAAGLILCAFVLGIVGSISGYIMLGDSEGWDAGVSSDERPGYSQVVDYRIDLPSDARPFNSQVVEYRIDVPW